MAKSMPVFGRSGQETQTVKACSLWVTENLSNSNTAPWEICSALITHTFTLSTFHLLTYRTKHFHQEHLVNKWLGKYYLAQKQHFTMFDLPPNAVGSEDTERRKKMSNNGNERLKHKKKVVFLLNYSQKWMQSSYYPLDYAMYYKHCLFMEGKSPWQPLPYTLWRILCLIQKANNLWRW